MNALDPQLKVSARPGRPRQAEAERRTERLPAVRVTLAELAFAQARADDVGLDLAAFCRTAVLHRSVDRGRQAQTDTVLVQLNRLGVTLQRMTAQTNGQADRQHLDQVLVELRATLAGLARSGA